jgi:hypothetical protein
VADTILPELPALVDDILEALRVGVPAYAQPLDGSFGRGVRLGVESALREFVELIGRPDSARHGRDVYVNLGRGEMRAGRSLNALLAAYRLGARVAWRRISAAGVRAGLAPETMYVLAEAMFAYIDELSADSVEGYALEQSLAAGEAQRRRRRLVELMVQPASDPAAIESAAAEAGWRLPRRLAVLAVDAPDADSLSPALPPDAVAAHLEGGVIVLVPDPEAPGRDAALRRAAGSMPAGLGPTVAWAGAARSSARAGAALDLARRGGPAGSFVRAREHLADLLLTADRELARELAAERLSPLDGTPAPVRARLAETLRAWLDHQGRLQPVATALHVHPQTVRYRLGQLRERFGTALDDPAGRFELALALRAEAVAAADEA